MNAAVELDTGAALLGDTVRKALEAASPHHVLTTGSEPVSSIARRHWALAVEMGWLGLLIPEQDGGAGLDLAAAATVAEILGSHLFCGPFATTAVLAVSLASAAQRDGAMAGVAATIAKGDMAVCLAALPESGTWPAREAGLTLDADGRLFGVRELVEHPELASQFLAFDLVDRGEAMVEMLVALVPPGPGVRVVARQSLDVTCPVARIEFSGAAIPAGLSWRARLPRLELDRMLRPFHVVTAAELVGIAQAALDRAVAHARERRQFDQPIGSFQAIKHRLADALALVMGARLAVRRAAAVDDVAAILAARTLAAEAALKACGDCIQVQGAMGFSWENDAHLYLKRARRLSALFGDMLSFRRMIADRFIASVLARSAGAPEVSS